MQWCCGTCMCVYNMCVCVWCVNISCGVWSQLNMNKIHQHDYVATIREAYKEHPQNSKDVILVCQLRLSFLVQFLGMPTAAYAKSGSEPQLRQKEILQTWKRHEAKLCHGGLLLISGLVPIHACQFPFHGHCSYMSYKSPLVSTESPANFFTTISQSDTMLLYGLMHDAMTSCGSSKALPIKN